MKYYLKRFLKIISKYFIGDIINLFSFIALIIGSFIIASNIDDAGTVMKSIGILFLVILVVSGYISYLYHKKKDELCLYQLTYGFMMKADRRLQVNASCQLD